MSESTPRASRTADRAAARGPALVPDPPAGRRTWEAVAVEVAAFAGEVRDLPVAPEASAVTPAALRSWLADLYAFDAPVPLADVAAVCGAWFHVDAAWGGMAAFVPRLRPVLAGVERADSVTWDAHKGLSVPMGAGMFFCRHPGAVARAFAITTSYMPPAGGTDTVDPYATTAQWSRRAIGLKLFLALAELGVEGYGALIDRQAQVAERIRDELRRAGWLVVNETPLPVVCFTHPEIRAGRLSTSDVLRGVYERRRVWVSDVVLGQASPAGSDRVLRACVTSMWSDTTDVACLVEELETVRRDAMRVR